MHCKLYYCNYREYFVDLSLGVLAMPSPTALAFSVNTL